MSRFKTVRLSSILGRGARHDIAVRLEPAIEQAIPATSMQVGKMMLSLYGIEAARVPSESVALPPDAYVFTLQQASIQSSAGIIGLQSFEVIEDTLDHTSPEIDCYSREGAGEVRGFDQKPRPEGGFINLQPPSFQLKGRYASFLLGGTQNYYHWLLLNLGRLALLRNCELSGIDGVLLPATLTRTQAESLAAISYLGDVPTWFIRPGQSLATETLIVPWNIASIHGVNRKAVSCLRSIAPKQVEGALEKRSRKIYVDRRKSALRKLMNEDEVALMLAKRGFQTVFLEDCSFAAQVAIFRKARVVVGPHGAGLTNMVFCERQAQIIELMPIGTLNWCYRNLAIACDHAYDCVLGQSLSNADDARWNEPWVISVTHLSAALDLYDI